MDIFCLFQVSVVAFLHYGVTVQSSCDVHLLMEYLFTNYSVIVRPVHDNNQATDINIALNFIHLKTMDIKTQIMISMGFFSITWTDEYLKWNPKDFGGIKNIIVPEDKIWRPDYVIDNNISVKEKLEDGNSVSISSGGQVQWEPGYIGFTVCAMDITYFPFDTQTCSVEVLPWMMTNESIHTYSEDGVYLKYFRENGEFELVDSSVDLTRYHPRYKKSESLEGASFVLVFRRKTTFYWLSLVSPLIAFPFLSPLSFLVPADSGEKTTLAITALLSVFVFMGTVYDTLPKLSSPVSYIVLLTSVQILISLLTVVCNVIILCIHRLSSERPVPLCLKKLFNSCRSKQRMCRKVTMGNLDSETDVVVNRTDEVTWEKVAGCLDKVCFVVSFICVSLATIIFAVVMF